MGNDRPASPYAYVKVVGDTTTEIINDADKLITENSNKGKK